MSIPVKKEQEGASLLVRWLPRWFLFAGGCYGDQGGFVTALLVGRECERRRVRAKQNKREDRSERECLAVTVKVRETESASQRERW